MGEFDIQYARNIPQPQATAAPMDMGAAVAPWQALAQAGQGFYELGADIKQKKDQQLQKEYELQQFTEIQNGKLLLSEYDSETRKMLQGINDPQEITKLSQQRLQGRDKIWKDSARLPESVQAMEYYSRKTLIPHAESLDNMRFEKQQENAFNVYDVQYSGLVKEGRFEDAAVITEGSYKKGIISDTEYRRRVNELPELEQVFHVEQIREMSQEAFMASNSKDKSYEIIDKAKAEGLITAKDQKILGNSIDQFAAGREAKAKQEKYTQSLNEYKDFTSKIASGDMTYEMLGNSTLKTNKEDEALWAEAIKAQYDPPPTKAEYSGYSTVAKTVLDASTLKISEKNAYNQLLTERYINKSITDTEYNWALKKIKDPYPAPVSNDMKTVFENNESKIKGRFQFSVSEKEKSRLTNEYLMGWVDLELKAGRTPDAKQMQIKSNWFMAGAKPKLEIGEQEIFDGKTWTVVGFDPVTGEEIFEDGL